MSTTEPTQGRDEPTKEEWLTTVLTKHQGRLNDATIAAMMAKQGTDDPETRAIYTGIMLTHQLEVQNLQAIINTGGRSV